VKSALIAGTQAENVALSRGDGHVIDRVALPLAILLLHLTVVIPAPGHLTFSHILLEGIPSGSPVAVAVVRLGCEAQPVQRFLQNRSEVAHPLADLGLAGAEQTVAVGLVGVLFEVDQHEVQLLLAAIQAAVGSFLVLLVHPPMVSQRVLPRFPGDQFIRAASANTTRTFAYSS
jgi:hypothetical protein